MRNFTILAVLVGSIITFQAQGAVYVSGTNALYHFDSDLVDSSGNGWNFSGSATFDTSTKKLGTASLKTGTEQFTVSTTALHMNDDYSINFWVQPTTEWETGSPNATYLFTKHQTGVGYGGIGYSAFCTDDYLEAVQGEYATACKQTANYNFNANTWYMITYTRGGSTGRLYVNGTEINNGTNNSNWDFNAVYWLNGEPGGTGKKDFYIDELVLVNDEVLSTSTIISLYNSGDGAEICVTEGCDESSPSSTPSSTTSTSTDMTTYETVITYYLVFLTVLGGAWFGYKLLT